MGFSELSAADAELYRTVIEEDGPILLAELAQLLRADCQDLDQFDGSAESLVPLWTWFISFARAGFPGVPPDARSRREAVEEIIPGTSRQDYASEFLVHYLFEVAKRELRDVVWALDTWKPGMSFQRTVMQSVNDRETQIPYSLDSFCWGLVHLLMSDRGGAEAPDNLLHRTLRSMLNLPQTAVADALTIPRSGVSILEGLGEPGPRRPPLTFVPAAEHSARDAAELEDDEPVGDELILAAPDTDVENLEDARPLDAEAVAQTLTRLGFVTSEGEPITAAVILAEEMTEFMRTDHEVAVFATAAYGGKLRALHVDSINPTKAQWEEVMTALQTLASSLDAKLAREDEFDFFEDE
ncbi:hypothetical protein [Salinibacterium sp. M195]|uniref:hypothetical protein n=1 Tax=Salinibacterium sp. M195 TaxID=2583374 RepID=UPI001C628E51|nr:hypothetical protein [Salinibacterium sp. M195]QYH35845.1 hypothetical protein FFT87_07705 [Salinibacterium sp. M195]